jgi:anti-sigma regulatory factor (Ser/Thr protein kinase)
MLVSIAAESRTFGVSTQGVTAIDDWIEQVAARWQISERATFNLRLCIAELAANALEHGSAGSGADQIVVTLAQASDGVEVEFLDSRAPFDPTANTRPAKPSPSEAGGLGLMLLRAYAEELSYCNDGTYNRVKFKIRSA